MKFVRFMAVCAAIGIAPTAMAQKWEFGGGLGGTFYNTNDATNNGQTAQAGIKTNIASSLWLVHNPHKNWGGEVRFDYQRGDLQLKQAGTEALFGAETYGMHYDFQYHFRDVESRIRPFLSAGAGVKFYRGTGTEAAVQPLSQFALLTKTSELQPMVSLGAGVKWQIAHAVQLRLEVHDYLTPMPTQVIVPNVGTVLNGWLNNIVPMVGLSYTF